MSRPQPYRVGDRVRIIVPEAFIRCGYEVTAWSECEQLSEDAEWLARFNASVQVFAGAIGVSADQRFSDQLLKAAAARVAAPKFGGERRIFTESRPELAGQAGEVKQIKRHKTGTYTPAEVSRATGCDEGGDYTPAYLADEQTRIILCVDLGEWHYAWVESVNVAREAPNV